MMSGEVKTKRKSYLSKLIEPINLESENFGSIKYSYMAACFFLLYINYKKKQGVVIFICCLLIDLIYMPIQ